MERVSVGTLVVGMLDAKTRSMVWRSTASKDLDLNQSPEKWEKKLNKAAEKMFKHYPAPAVRAGK
jgi:anti-sigma-K factor RskA